MPKMISCEDFEQIKEIEVKLNILFDYTRDIYENEISKDIFCQERIGKCEKRFKKIENRKKFDTTFAGITGLIGGFLAFMGGKIFK